MLVYGEPGVGKTRFLGTAQDEEATRPLLIFDVEGGTTTLRGRKDVDVVSVRSMAELNAGFNKLYQSKVRDKDGVESIYYKTVGIDSLSELQKLDMKEIMKVVVSNRPDLDEDVPGMREWGKNGEHMRKIVRAFRDLPCNVIFTAHSNTAQDNVTNITTIFPSFSGKLKNEIAGFIDVVGYMFATVSNDETVRKIQFAKTMKVSAKDRTDSLGDLLENPTVPLLWSKINA